MASVSLLLTANFIIKAMSEVKAQEDGYQIIKDLCTHIYGLHSTCAIFARRNRKLLLEGPVLRLTTLSNIDPPSNFVHSNNNWSSCAKYLVSSSRQSRLASNLESFGSLSQAKASERVNILARSPKNTDQDKNLATIAMNVFIFNDVILFAQKIKKRSNRLYRWQLDSHIGICRLLSVTALPDMSEGAVDICTTTRRLFNCESTDNFNVVLELLPTHPQVLAKNIILKDATVISVCFALSLKTKTTSQQDLRTPQMWLSALRKCEQSTISAVTAPVQLGDFVVGDGWTCAEDDLQHPSQAILTTGLPIPKSPSLQFVEANTGKDSEARQLEREERGWWFLRFRQVAQEMRRHDEKNFDQMDLSLTP